MAVKADVIKARIKALFPTLNLSAERLNALAENLKLKPADDADEVAIDKAIKDFNDIYPFSDIAKEDDRVRNLEKLAKSKKTDGEETAEEKAKRLADEKAAEDAKAKADAEAPEWAKTMIGGITKQVETLKEQVEGFQKNQTVTTKLQQAKQLFNSNELLKAMPENLKESWLKRVNTEEDLEQQIGELADEYKTLTGGNPPAGGEDGDDDTKKPAGAPPKSFKTDAPNADEVKDLASSI